MVLDEEHSLLLKALSLRSPVRCLSHARYGIAWRVLGAANNGYRPALK